MTSFRFIICRVIREIEVSNNAAASTAKAVAELSFHDMERGFETDPLDEAVCIPVMAMQTSAATSDEDEA